MPTTAGVPAAALFLIMFGLTFNFLLLKRWRIFLTFSVSLIVFMLPMIVAVVRGGEALTARFKTIAVWYDSPGAVEVIKRIAVRYLDYFNPYFIFIRGDGNPRHNTGVGLLFLFMLPLVIIGLYVLIRHCRRNPWYRFILASLLVYPVAAVLTIHRFHGTRSLDGVPFWSMIAVIGALWCWRRREKFKVVLTALAVFAVCETGYYLYDYFTAYPARTAACLRCRFPYCRQTGGGGAPGRRQPGNHLDLSVRDADAGGRKL